MLLTQKISQMLTNVFQAGDNLYILRQFYPTHMKMRVLEKCDPLDVRKQIAMGKTGRWIPGVCRMRPTAWPYMFDFRLGPLKCSTMPGVEHSLWTDEEYRIILNNIQQIQESPEFNPYGLEMPYLGENKVPWPFREDSCPRDADKELLYRIYSGRLVVMTVNCNFKHLTEESPATLLLEHIVQWFETGGKCHFFGFTVTPFSNYPTSFSFGRGVTQRLADGTTRDIKPGEAMKTGWKVLFPTNIFKDYDLCRRTVIVESWRANVFRYQYPGGQRLLKILESAILGLADSTKWYSSLGKLDEYGPCILRQYWRMSYIDGLKVKDFDLEAATADLEMDECDMEDDDEWIALKAEEGAIQDAVQPVTGALEDESMW